MTAAHCADGFSKFDVVIGAHEVRNPSEEGHLETTTREAFVNSGWDTSDLSNDVAILKVDKITFNGKNGHGCNEKRFIVVVVVVVVVVVKKKIINEVI